MAASTLGPAATRRLRPATGTTPEGTAKPRSPAPAVARRGGCAPLPDRAHCV